MKNFKDYLKECNATPMNTIGMGNPSMPTDDAPGSGDALCFINNKKKRVKKNNLTLYKKSTKQVLL